MSVEKEAWAQSLEKKALALPTTPVGGSDKGILLEMHMAVKDAVESAIRAMTPAHPHMRDFATLADYTVAKTEWRTNMEKLREVSSWSNEMVLALDEML